MQKREITPPPVMTFAAACNIWGLATGSLWNHVRRGQFLPAEAWQEAEGRPWLVTREAMERLHGRPKQRPPVKVSVKKT